MNSAPTVSFWLDNRRANKEGLFPIKLVITYKRNNKKYSTKNILPPDLQYMSEGNFLASYKSTTNTETSLAKKVLKNISELYILKRNEILTKVLELPNFSFQLFEEQVLNRKEIERDDLIGIGLKKIKSFSEDQLTSIGHYQMTLNSIGRYRFSEQFNIFGNDNEKYLSRRIEFSELTEKYLENYVRYLKDKDLKTATIGIHLRSLRALFNIAISKKIINRDFYPFGKGKIEISNGVSEKRILSTTQLLDVINADTINNQELFGKQMWLLSFFCYGMNIADLIHLKDSDFINDHFFRFNRRKTRKKDNVSIKVYMVNTAKDILDNLRVSGCKFTLPALNDENGFKYDSPKKVKAKNQWTVKRINRGMKSICGRLGIEKVTTYDARYTFANLAKNNAVPYNFIQECMGHANNSSITDVYMNAFDDDKIIEYTKTIYKDLIDG